MALLLADLGVTKSHSRPYVSNDNPFSEAKPDQGAWVLAKAFARHPERFPNGRPSPRPLPPVAWINPPAKREAELTGENTVARQSSAAAIVDRGATSKAVTEVEPLASPHLMPEDRYMAAAQ